MCEQQRGDVQPAEYFCCSTVSKGQRKYDRETCYDDRKFKFKLKKLRFMHIQPCLCNVIRTLIRTCIVGTPLSKNFRLLGTSLWRQQGLNWCHGFGFAVLFCKAALSSRL